jgi:hypothetical protein
MSGHQKQESEDSPIERYLDRLLAESIPGGLRDTRHLLAEVEAHLRDAAEDAERSGLTRVEAEQEAVDRFGPPDDLANAERRTHSRSVSEIGRSVISSGLLLSAVAGIAVGVSGFVAAGMEYIGGSRFLVELPSGSSLSASNCARWIAGSPTSATCAQAGLKDWVGDTILFRLVAGILGLVAFGLFFAARRRWSQRGRYSELPAVVVETIAVVAFGSAAIWLTVAGIDAVLVSSGHGAGQWLSAAPIALALSLAFGLRLLRDLRRTGDWSYG